MEDAHRSADFEVLSRYGKSMMPVSVMDVDYTSRSIARSENLMKREFLALYLVQTSKRCHDDPIVPEQSRRLTAQIMSK